MIAVNYWELLLLGAIPEFTIFLGLPMARLQNVSPRKKGFLNAIAIGILVFLIIDVFSHAWESVGNVAQDTYSGKVSVVTGIPTILALFGGLAIGLLGLVLYESIYMSGKNNRGTSKRFSFHNGMSAGPLTESDEITSIGVGTTRDRLLLLETTAYRIAMLMYNSGRRQTTNSILMLGIFVGLYAGFVTDLLVTLGGA